MRPMVGCNSQFGSDARPASGQRSFPPNLSEFYGPSVAAHGNRLLSRTSKKACYLMRTSGTVKFFNSAKGFGFITPDEGGKDVFVHATAVEAAGMRALNEGDRVSFEIEDDRRGRGKQAAQLKPA
jgi:cold shock protein